MSARTATGVWERIIATIGIVGAVAVCIAVTRGCESAEKDADRRREFTRGLFESCDKSCAPFSAVLTYGDECFCDQTRKRPEPRR